MAGRLHNSWLQLVYLVTPVIGGLFGAVSHEYIDFTSLRNRNKQLHLRRSFYSLDNLREEDQAQLQQLPVLLERLPTTSQHSKQHQQCQPHPQPQPQPQPHHSSSQHHYQQQETLAHHQIGPNTQSARSTVLEVSSAMVNGSKLVAAARRSRRPSSNSSLESSEVASSSSVVSLARGSTLAADQHDQQLFGGASANNNNNRKLAVSSSAAGLNSCSRSNSYSRRLKMEHQHLQLADRHRKISNQCSTTTQSPATAATEFGKNQAQRTSLRRSDFDSNFLISSSMGGQAATGSPTANPRHNQVINSSVAGWM